MEARFGHSFARIQVHADERAAESAAALGAQAFTLGRHIVFGPGAYRPHDETGRGTIAHELTHTLQQRESEVGAAKLSIASADHPLEGKAKDVAGWIRRASSAGPDFGSSMRSRVSPALLGTREALGGTIQRQDACSESASSSASGIIEDYESQECRPAEPEELVSVVPESDAVDGEFWWVPEGVRDRAEPVFDDELGVVVAFRYSSGGYYEIYDLNGDFVESGEPGLESPLIDPIDLLAGGLVGLGRGLLRGAGTAAVRGAAAKGAGVGLAGAGIRATISLLSRQALAAVRGVYRGLRFQGALSFTGTTIVRMADPARRVPHHILKLAVRFGKRVPDPQGVPGAFLYRIPMIRNGKQYTLEIVLRESDRTVLHFLYK